MVKKENKNLASANPDLLIEWNYEKNGDLTPDSFTVGSHKKVWWKCSEGHEWEAEIKSRVYGNGCPICANKKVFEGYNDLKTKNPELAKEWNYEKNGNLTPEKVMGGSHKKVWWKCSEGHEWEAEIKSRVYGNGCPICANQKVLAGYNDLKTKNPELAKEWNYEKNGDLTPEMVLPNSNKKAWWKCQKGHEWEAVISNRSFLKHGCPICAKELQTSFPEQAILFYLEQVFPDVEHLNTTAIGTELDIYIPSEKMAIEYDGVYWHNNKRKRELDIRKNALCKNKGISLYRIREKGLENFSDCVCIFREDNNSDEGLNEVINKMLLLFNVFSITVNVDRDRTEIINKYYSYQKRNSIEALFPEIANEWNYEKNGDLTPDIIPAKTNRQYWWKCSEGHEWKSSPNSRTGNNKTGCPYCSNRRVLIGYNDLKTKNPELAKEWNYEKNGDLTPEMVVPNSNKKVWWKCSVCGYEWEAMVTSRNRGTGCIHCGTKKRTESRIFNSLTTLGSLADNNPDLAKEWSTKKNEGLTPEMVLSNSNKKVWWKCSVCGYEWEASINNRNKGKGCPQCGTKKRIESWMNSKIATRGSLAVINPELAKEWNYEKNGDLTPEMVLPTSSKKVWWKCSVCGYEWEAIIANRTKGRGCPICARKKRIKKLDNTV